jgi:hypothetical protein
MNGRIRSRIETLVLILGIAHLTGCSSWQTQLEPPDVALRSNPDRARISTSDGSRRTLHWPAVHDSLLVGNTTGYSEYGDRQDKRVAIPLDSVTRIEFHELSRGRTMALFLTVFGVAMALAVTTAVTGPWFHMGPTSF